MNKKKYKKRKKKKKSLVRKFFRIMFSILTIYFIGIICFFVYAYIEDNKNIDENSGIINTIAQKVSPKLPERTIGLVVVNDSGDSRSDTILLVSYNSINNQISSVNIPRDTKVSIPEDMWSVMVQNFPVIARDNPNKKRINVFTYYGKERGMEFLETYLEDLLDIKIDYYAHFNLEGFRHLVDSVGGIEFNVPIRMKYSDPTQNLYIDLQPGLQLLDGDKAEQLLRFRKDNYNRGYQRGDLQRIEVQQEFMKLFIKKVTNIDSILSNPKAYYTTLKEYLDTNFGLNDALKYIGELKNIDIENIQTYTIPIESIGDFVVLNEDEVKDFAYEVFKAPTIKQEDIVYEDSFDKSIQVLNGSYTKGMASKTKDILQDNGYIVGNTGDSLETKSKETKIYVAKHGVANDLQKFFTNSKIIVNPEKALRFEYDITIVIGTEDKLKENISDALDTSLNNEN